MKCPFCGHEELKVTDSRDAIEQNAIRRRRECLGCGRRFTTFEMIELSIQVHKRDDRYEDFQIEKLTRGLEAACMHTPIGREQIKQVAHQIMVELMEKQVRELSSKELGEMVMQHLQHLDSIAYIRFACVYRRFKDLGELEEVIASISKKERSEECP